MGPRDTCCFEMQIVTYAHCPSQAWPPIDRLKQILLIIEYLMGIIKSLMEVLTAHFQYSTFPQETCLRLTAAPACSVKKRTQLIAIKPDVEFTLRILGRFKLYIVLNVNFFTDADVN